jgi:hypothetical protein
MDWYYRYLLRSVRLICALMIAGNTVLILCVLLDWAIKAGWGYPWWSLLFLLAMLAFAVLIRRGAAWGLRHL